MSKPLIASADEARKASRWHADVFEKYGYDCWLHKTKTRATDAAHVLKRSHIGTKLAYCDVDLGRPLCRSCHIAQEAGKVRFSLRDRQNATRAHNRHARVKFEIPTE